MMAFAARVEDAGNESAKSLSRRRQPCVLVTIFCDPAARSMIKTWHSLYAALRAALLTAISVGVFADVTNGLMNTFAT
jgi:hypothetical protein